MSDCEYDNVELSELINDLKNVGRNENLSNKKDTKIKFQCFSPSSALLERRLNRPFQDSSYRNSQKEKNTTYNDNFEEVKFENFSNVNVTKDRRDNIDDLQMELLMVKEELALLKRTSSLASHPIFGNTLPANEILGAEKSKRMMVSSQYHLSNSTTTSNDISKNYITKYGSSSNICPHNPTPSKFQYQSLNRLNATSTFSAHRDNMEKISRANSLVAGISNQNLQPKHLVNYYEEIENYTLQPIGKGIQTLSGSITSISKNEQFNNQNDFKDSCQRKNINIDDMKKVKKTKHIWLQLDSSRESCKRKLLNKEVGSFIIRIQSGYKFSGGLMFELVLKITDNSNCQIYEDENFECFPLKEFSEINVKGIKLIGYSLEPMFYSIDSFVEQHIESPLGLPCCLKLPIYSMTEDQLKIQSPFNRRFSRPFNILSKKISGSLTSLSSIKSQYTISTYAKPFQEQMETELLFLGKVKVDRWNGANAVRHAVDKILINGYQPKHCIEINAQLDSLSGITLIDNERILFFKKILLPNIIVCSCVDPLHRGLNSEYLSTKGIKNSKIFGIVCHKKKILLKENQVYVFGEFNADMQMEKVIRFIQKHFEKPNLNQFK